jgi:hypothetical protein
MDQRTRYAVTLSRAEETLGGRDRLARFLNVPLAKLDAWLKGEEDAPLEAFLGSLDVIADGPFAGEERPIRVAVIREKR